MNGSTMFFYKNKLHAHPALIGIFSCLLFSHENHHLPVFIKSKIDTTHLDIPIISALNTQAELSILRYASQAISARASPTPHQQALARAAHNTALYPGLHL